MSDRGPLCLIVNPRAGTADAVREILDRLRRRESAELRETRGPGDGGVRGREAVRDGFRRIVVVGGDGTLNEVVNGVAPELDDIELGLIPAGTGNDFARAAGLGPEPEAALEAIAAWSPRPVDVVRVDSGDETRYMLNASSGGFSTAVGEALTHENKDTWGALAYLISAAKVIPELRAYRVRATTDSGEVLEQDCLNVVVANGGCLGGGITVVGDARLDDGALHLVLVPDVPLVQLGVLVSRLIAGDAGVEEQLLVRGCKGLRLEADPALGMNVDGEPLGSTPVRYELLPGRLRVVMH